MVLAEGDRVHAATGGVRCNTEIKHARQIEGVPWLLYVSGQEKHSALRQQQGCVLSFSSEVGFLSELCMHACDMNTAT